MTQAKLVSGRIPHAQKIVQFVLDERDNDCFSQGDIITHISISELTGVPMKYWISAMTSACKTLLREHKIRLRCESRVGYRWLKNVDRAGDSERTLAQGRRKAVKAAEQAVNVDMHDYLSLSRNDQSLLDLQRQKALMTVQFLDEKCAKRILVGNPIVQNSYAHGVLPPEISSARVRGKRSD